MPERLNYHFEPQKGWINDPNGLVYFKGKYHAFFQYNPFEPKWGPMYWGHAANDDLVHWEELPIALSPDQKYEDSKGCFSGSAIEKDGVLFLFYTSVSHELGQTQSIAMSTDGINFEKYKGNPVISQFPEDGSADFRDPKVTKIGATYYMVCGSGKDGIGKVLLYKSDDLFHWHYVNVLFEGAEYGDVIECPDFFPLGGKYILMFSIMGKTTYSTQFVCGNFHDDKFEATDFCTPEAGPHFYAPQTFLDHKNRRIMIGWLYNWEKELDKGAEYAGALTIPRELKMKSNRITNYPVEEALPLLKADDPLVSVDGNTVIIEPENLSLTLDHKQKIEHIAILRDTKTIEVFINAGESSCSYWFAH